MPTLTPETKILLDRLRDLNLPPIDTVPVKTLRDQYEAMVALYGGSGLPDIASVDETISLEGRGSVKIRRYATKAPKRVILFAHGGGWTRGSLNTHHVMCQRLCEAITADLIAVDYSLSPENVYPKAIDELEAVYDKLSAVDAKGLPIVVAGDSAGGNLAAGLIVRLNLKKKTIPEKAVLLYPALDLTNKSASLNEFATGYLLTKDAVGFYAKNYLGADLSKAALPETSPLWQMNAIDFPETLIVSAECDPIRDDAREAANILRERELLAGHLEVPGVVHGFAQFPVVFPEALKAFEWIKAKFDS